MQIQVRINEEGALRNQRFAFSDRFTLVAELMQNARRAGASCIEIIHDAENRTLRVADNGCGVADFQQLLTFNESGWDEGLRSDEKAFGVGFSKCLYAATRCIVTSNGLRVDFDTAQALAKVPVDVTAAPDDDDDIGEPGTVVELHGVDLPGLAERIATLTMGYAVAVIFNGQVQCNGLATSRLPMTPTAIGGIHLAGTRDGKFSRETLVFLQGFCVLRIGYAGGPSKPRPDQVNVVHLDPRLFVARLPDRDKLIDEDQQRQRIDAAIKARWGEVLAQAKSELPPRRFVETFYNAMRCWDALALLNDIDDLPVELCEQISGYPYQDGLAERSYLTKPTQPAQRQDIESGRVSLVALDPIGDDNAGRWMFARAKGQWIFKSAGLDPEHWVQRHVHYPEDQYCSVEAVDEAATTEFEGRWSWPTVVLCKAVRIGIGDEAVDITDGGVYDQGTLYIPEGELTGDSVRQASDYCDEHLHFAADDLEADREALADLILRLRSPDPKATIESLLVGLRLEKYPRLHGRVFRLTVGSAPLGHAVELMA
jgi:hypothetical protein